MLLTAHSNQIQVCENMGKLFKYRLQNRTRENGCWGFEWKSFFRVCDFFGNYRCSTTDFEIAHTKMGGCVLGLLKPIFTCAIFAYSLCFQVCVREFLCPISLFTFCITYMLFIRIWSFNSFTKTQKSTGFIPQNPQKWGLASHERPICNK